MIERLYYRWNNFEFDTGAALGFYPLYRVYDHELEKLLVATDFEARAIGRLCDEPFWQTLNEVERYLIADGFCIADRNHYWNPERVFERSDAQGRDVADYGPLHWHTDSADGHSRADNVVVMCATLEPDAGTLISGPLDLPYEERFRLTPWTVYLLAGDVIHKAPDKRKLPAIVFRWYQSAIGRDADNGQSDWNWRRDEDGQLIYSVR